MIFEILASIKEIIVDYVKHRLFPITVLVIVLFSILIHRLFVLQIVEGQEHMDNFIYKTEKTLSVEAVRGNIYDRNGNLLAYNELAYSLNYSNDARVSEKAKKLGVSENVIKNEILSKTIDILEQNGDSLYVDFPIKEITQGNYAFTCGEITKKSFIQNVFASSSYDNLTDEQKNVTPNELMEYLMGPKMFSVDSSYNSEKALKIVACRYKLWLNRFQQYVPVAIAYDISDRSNAAITEYSDELYGMEVSVKSLRRYNDAEYFAHIIGYIGAISAEEMELYNADLPEDKTYSGSEMVGKTGIEQYCESDLRGQGGTKTIYVDNLGKIIETVNQTSTTAGNDVYLTIDANLQKYCFDALEKEITSILLSNLINQLDVNPTENAPIPISDVYFGLINNNYIKLDRMKDKDATETEQKFYTLFHDKKEETFTRLEQILNTDFVPLKDLSSDYQDYMEYICEALSREGIYNSGKIDKDGHEYLSYTTDQTSLAEYLQYAISVEAISITSIEADSAYYDNDETYYLLADYILNYLKQDTEFDKLIIKDMIKSAEITGSMIIHLLYDQGVLNAEHDPDYEAFTAGNYGAFEFMYQKIQKYEITPAMLALAPCSGSVVVTDIDTGDVLAMVSYPSYDNNRLTNEVDSEYYNTLLEDKTGPLYNRATQQKTAPGSTYKPLSSIAGIGEGVIDAGTYLSCTGDFDKIEPPPHCWSYPVGHGGLNVSGGIKNSCNVFFYTVGYYLAITEDHKYNDSYGLDRLKKYATMFGLSETSGVELPETEPTISDTDSVRSAIGQGTNCYTPVQIAKYVTAIANSGTCYNLTLLDKVTDYEGKLVQKNKASVYNKLNEVTEDTWNAVHYGMRGVVTSAGPGQLINQLKVNIAGKTGTAQESEIMPDHALFISYAPYEAPEVSVTCVIQNGYSSGNARELASFVYAYMYDPSKLSKAEMNGNTSVSD